MLGDYKKSKAISLIELEKKKVHVFEEKSKFTVTDFVYPEHIN